MNHSMNFEALLLGIFFASSTTPAALRTSVNLIFLFGACSFNWLVPLTTSLPSFFNLVFRYF